MRLPHIAFMRKIVSWLYQSLDVIVADNAELSVGIVNSLFANADVESLYLAYEYLVFWKQESQLRLLQGKSVIGSYYICRNVE